MRVLEVVVNVSAQSDSGSELMHGMLLFNKGILLCFLSACCSFLLFFNICQTEISFILTEISVFQQIQNNSSKTPGVHFVVVVRDLAPGLKQLS